MRIMILSGIVSLSMFVGSIAAHAGDVTFVPEGGGEITVEDGDAMNYFSSGKHKKEQAAAAAQTDTAIQGKGVPASQLDKLPDSVNIEGKGEVKVKNGQIVAKTDVKPEDYVDCEQYKNMTGDETPDECKQKGGEDTTIKTEASTTPEEPKSLDQQLKEKEAETNTKIEKNAESEPVKAAVENTAIVDKQRGAKTNIISNTDTGVSLSE